MKLSNLSLAIFAALSLAACGGSGSGNDQTNPKKDDTPVKEPETQTPGEVAQDIVDPAQNGVVGKLDLKQEPSQGTLQYIRDKDSRFDRQANEEESTSATSILGVDADSQNPKFSNIVRARLVEDGEIKVIQYLGQERSEANNIDGDKSLQRQNNLNVKLRGLTSDDKGGEWDQPVKKADIETMLKDLKADIAVLEKNKDLQSNQKDKLAEAKEYKMQLEAILQEMKSNKNYGQGLVSLRARSGGLAQSNVFGDLKETSNDALGDDGVQDDSTGPEGIGLVAVNYDGLEDPTDRSSGVKEQTFQGLEKNSRSSTRIFGRYYNTKATNSSDYYNSYRGATTFVSKKGVGTVDDSNKTDKSGKLPSGDSEKAYENLVKSNLTAVANLAAEPLRLDLVQYGRVTGNLDPVEYTATDGEVQYVRSPFLNKGDEKAVDTYFYRGADATTVAEMEKLAKDMGDRKVTYKGHALMYGIDNSFHGGRSSQDVPTAIGTGAGAHALGNFVEATVDLANAEVKGNIYNVWKKDDSITSQKDTLVDFEGKIHGNTVLGEATRVYNTSDKADLRASFFGEKAAELGGSINSTTWQERYGAKGDVWGGVFGAKRSVTVKGLDNLDVGDVSNIR